MIYLAAFGISTAYVFLKSTQQQNVMYRKLWGILPCSMGMALLEVSGLLLIMKSGSLWMSLPIGTGAALGCYAAIYLHERIRNAHATEPATARTVSVAELSARRAGAIWAGADGGDDRVAYAEYEPEFR